jgi:hypothetical protein
LAESAGLGSTPNGLELSCLAEAGILPMIVAQAGGPGAPPYGPARRVSFSELLDGVVVSSLVERRAGCLYC